MQEQENQQNPSGQAEPASHSSVEAAAESGASAAQSEAAQGAPDLARELETARAEAKTHFDAFLLARADIENVRRRAQEDVSKARKFGTESFAESLLPVMDSLEAALADTAADPVKLREGVELTLRQLASAFERNRLVAINPLGEKFDPHRHQAIAMQPAEGVAANHVISVLQKGWTIADRVLRPALVTVAQG